MNKFKMWHLAVIALAVFLIFAAIVTAIVANKNYNSNKSPWRFGWNEDDGWDWNINFGVGNEYTIDQTKSIEIESATKIWLDTVTADINVTSYSGNKIEAHLYGKYTSANGEIELETTTIGNIVNIKTKYPKSNVTYTNLTLDILIPSDYVGDLELDSVSGYITLDCTNMDFYDVIIESVSGKRMLNTINADSLALNTISGDVKGSFPSGSVKVNGVSTKVNLTDLTQSVEVDTVSGNTSLTFDSIGEVNVASISGDVTITLLNDDDFYVNYDSFSGDFSHDILLTIIRQKGSDFEGHTGNLYATKINVDTVFGDLTIIN